MVKETTLEREARRAWYEWASGARGGGYAQNDTCANCHEHRYCRGRKREWLICLECFDLGASERRPPRVQLPRRKTPNPSPKEETMTRTTLDPKQTKKLEAVIATLVTDENRDAVSFYAEKWARYKLGLRATPPTGPNTKGLTVGEREAIQVAIVEGLGIKN